ncbi:Aspartyl/glutamyl-tRNA(Asn/Gln) amidotransferase subunit C [Nymphon striatum]|nr:Aspartyl/glutamyl-tRNA(Asn/Gln) amidotransferase subunit C [Nymphon striatum]
MSLSPEEVKKIAFLARLAIKEENISQYSEDLSGILDLVDQMDAAVTENIEPMAHPQDAMQRLRDDAVTEINQREKLMENAPATEDGLFLYWIEGLDMINKSLAELSVGLQSGKFSSVELTQFYLDRIKSLDSDLNAFITVTEEQALTTAKLADEKIANGSASGLTGIPLAHKDIFCTDGVKTSAWI